MIDVKANTGLRIISNGQMTELWYEYEANRQAVVRVCLSSGGFSRAADTPLDKSIAMINAYRKVLDELEKAVLEEAVRQAAGEGEDS